MENTKVPALRIENLTKTFSEKEAQILKGISFTVEEGEFCCILGPSGSGKTTLLRIIGGLLNQDSGNIFFRGQELTQVPSNKRDVGIVFQSFALFPHMSVFDNVAFPLHVRKMKSKEIEKKVYDILELVDLREHARKRPNQLSGGQKQRVALARAIVFEPRLLLMDEPLGSLDRRLRQSLEIEVRNIQQKLGIACIYVTHDQEEAMAVADRIVVLDGGRIVGYSTPIDLYYRPPTLPVADFLGDANIFPGIISSKETGVLAVDFLNTCCKFNLSQEHEYTKGEAVWIVIRPEEIKIDAFGHEHAIECIVREKLFLAGRWRLWLVPVNSNHVIIADISNRDSPAAKGDKVKVRWQPRHAHLIPKVVGDPYKVI